MDDRRFDNLAKAAAAGSTRRTVLKGLGGGLAALLAGFGFGVEEAAAGRCERRCRRDGDGGGGGGGGGGTTVAPQPVSTNPNGSGAGSTCASEATCLSGLTCFNGQCTACTTQCPEGSTATCCAAGVCQVLNGQDVCVLG